jgi:hypothetical protein
MTTMIQPDSSQPVDLNRLIQEFLPGKDCQTSPLGPFQHRDQVPHPFDGLLDHDGHMTETVESFYGCPVDVVVHRYHTSQNWYCREITLVETLQGKIVQYGIVRLNTQALQPEVWRKIESREVPLGRVLIEHEVLRRVELKRLWSIKAGPTLVEKLGVRPQSEVFGRTALIYCDGKPAIELLEIVSPPEHLPS